MLGAGAALHVESCLFGLLRTVADQAVIAIQNARLFKQAQEARAQPEGVRLQAEAANEVLAGRRQRGEPEARDPPAAAHGLPRRMPRRRHGDYVTKPIRVEALVGALLGTVPLAVGR